MSNSQENLMHRDLDADYGVDDLTKLAHPDENAVLYNLSRRYAHDKIYDARGADALCDKQNKLENEENMSLHLELEKRRRVAVEASKEACILKLKQKIKLLEAELNESKKTIALLSHTEILDEDKLHLHHTVVNAEQIMKENTNLRNTIDLIRPKMANMKVNILEMHKSNTEALENYRLVSLVLENLQSQENHQRMTMEVASTSNENIRPRNKALTIMPKNPNSSRLALKEISQHVSRGAEQPALSSTASKKPVAFPTRWWPRQGV